MNADKSTGRRIPRCPRIAHPRGVKRKKEKTRIKTANIKAIIPTSCDEIYFAAIPGILFLNYVHALLLNEIRKSCGTRSWSASGGRGTLSYHALDNRHEDGVNPNAMEAVRFGRIVPALSVSTLHLRSAPRAFGGRNQRGDLSVLRKR
jgi:hypothetical protein